MRKKLLTIFPKRSGKNQVVLADNDTDTEETELSEQAQRELCGRRSLTRLEDSTRTQREFENVIAWRDRRLPALP